MDAEMIEYLSALMPDAQVNCSRCEKLKAVGESVKGTEGIYCSDLCRMQSEGLLIKPQPKGMQLEGWDI